MKAQVKLHKPADATWTNARGESVPKKHITKLEANKERLAGQLYKAALAAEATLAQLHKAMDEACQQVAAQVRVDYELKNGKPAKPTKGSITWYNFDRSLKIEADVNDVVKWDDSMMREARQLLNEYLDSQLTSNQQIIRDLVNGAFSNRKGSIDRSKIFELLRHEHKINSSNFRKACQLMRDAQIVDRTKLYMRLSERQEDGSYRTLKLNFSDI